MLKATGRKRNVTKNTMIMSKLTAAYVAGLIDGDGYLGIMRKSSKRSLARVHYTPVVKVGMTDKDIIEWLQKSFGGNFYHRDNGQYKDLYQWKLANRTMKPFLDAIYPYLRVKKAQADVLKRFFGTFGSDDYYQKKQKGGLRNGGTRYSKTLKDETLEYRKELYKQIRKLNHRGIIVP